MAKVGVRHLGFFELNFRHLAKVGVRNLRRDRKMMFWAFFVGFF
jgi:hypothetical protein|tara:strand:+ start:121 stop:252 length:132 start_codon:yes stop_codon:yes gene_type:complete